MLILVLSAALLSLLTFCLVASKEAGYDTLYPKIDAIEDELAALRSALEGEEPPPSS